MSTYTPQVNVVDARKFRDNLLSYLKTTQTAALRWANEGPGLVPIKDFHKSPRLVTDFPATTCLQMDHKSVWGDGGMLEIDFSVVLETAIVHGKKDILADMGPKYSMAIESMLVNVPETTFNADSIIDITSTQMGAETVFAVQGKYKNQFIEVFQTKASWHIEASAFAS